MEEGPYVFDPDDPGGETKYGIAKRFHPNLDIKNLTIAQATEIYDKEYWDRYSVEELPEQIRLQYFDMVVNMGPNGATRIIQTAISMFGIVISIDGRLGPKTITEAHSICHADKSFKLNSFILANRMEYYAEKCVAEPKKLKFLKGWNKRSKRIYLTAIK